MDRTRTILIAALALFATVGLTACGNKKQVERYAENEGVYFESGPLKYQIQMTRQLNPAQAQDRELMFGIAPADRIKAPRTLWYATFVRIENPTDKYQIPATVYRITDTNGDVFTPVPIDPTQNPFAYQAVPIPPGGSLPNINSIPGQTDLNGKMILFKIPAQDIALRPLVLHVVNTKDPSQSGRVKIDI